MRLPGVIAAAAVFALGGSNLPAAARPQHHTVDAESQDSRVRPLTRAEQKIDPKLREEILRLKRTADAESTADDETSSDNRDDDGMPKQKRNQPMAGKPNAELDAEAEPQEDRRHKTDEDIRLDERIRRDERIREEGIRRDDGVRVDDGIRPFRGRRDVQIDRRDRALVQLSVIPSPMLERRLHALRATILSTSPARRSIVAWIPLVTLEQLAQSPSIRSIRPAADSSATQSDPTRPR